MVTMKVRGRSVKNKNMVLESEEIAEMLDKTSVQVQLYTLDHVMLYGPPSVTEGWGLGWIGRRNKAHRHRGTHLRSVKG